MKKHFFKFRSDFALIAFEFQIQRLTTLHNLIIKTKRIKTGSNPEGGNSLKQKKRVVNIEIFTFLVKKNTL